MVDKELCDMHTNSFQKECQIPCIYSVPGTENFGKGRQRSSLPKTWSI